MKRKFCAAFFLISNLLTLGAPPWDFIGSNLNDQPDGMPDILWRRKSATDTYVWQMNQTSYVRAYQLPSTGGDVGYKIVASADFNQDGKQDILLRHETSGLTFVWYMNGPIYTQSYGQITEQPASTSWKIVGAADFGSYVSGIATTTLDNKPDILWQDETTGQIAIWLMNGMTRTATVLLDAPATWKVVAVADIGSSPGTAPANTLKDGRPDIVLADFGTGLAGLLAIRYMQASGFVS